MRVLLLNPPGKHNYIRDYFCSKLSKAGYVSPPATLLLLSGLVGSEHEVMVLDAIAERLDAGRALARMGAWRPEAVITLAGEASWDEDRAFFTALKQATGARVIGVGDVLLDQAEARLSEAPGLDAVLLNFVTPHVLSLLKSDFKTAIPNTVFRRRAGQGVVHGGLQRMQGAYQVPRPRHELFPLRHYRFPFMLRRPMSTVLTDYGCPFQCSFCVMPPLGFGTRPLDDVTEELAQLHSLGVRELFFIDQTFGAQRKRAQDLCERLALGRRFTWSCFSRADVLDEALLGSMARAGCHTIIFGVESGSPEILTQYRKRMEVTIHEKTMATCRRAGIRTAATFLLGLPGETEPQALETVRLALRLPLDFVSFNIAVPRPGTPLKQQAREAGLINETTTGLDQSGGRGAMATREMTAGRILQLRARAVRAFYLRPGYLLRRLAGIRSWWDFRSQLADGWQMLTRGN